MYAQLNLVSLGSVRLTPTFLAHTLSESLRFQFQIYQASSGKIAYFVVTWFGSSTSTSSRYRLKNLFVPFVLPGPGEPNAEQLQELQKILVDELIKLWKDGIIVKTPLHPNGEVQLCLVLTRWLNNSLGRLLRGALLALINDHPAMCKVAGFADHAHKAAPCPKCGITHDGLCTEASINNGTVSSKLVSHSHLYHRISRTHPR
jgi:hypothetical protein